MATAKKTIKKTEQNITQKALDSYKGKLAPNETYQIKEASKGRNIGVFMVQILPSGEMDFYFKYFMGGKSKSMKIGRFGNSPGRLSLAQAKAEFRNLSAIYSTGIDPKAQKIENANKQEEEKHAQDEIERKKQMQGNLGQLAEFYIEYLKKNKSETHYNNVKKAFNKDLYTIAPETKASDVTKADIIKILHKITERNALVMANRMRVYLSAMFGYGINFDDSVEAIKRETLFFIKSNPVTETQTIIKKEKRGDRSLTEPEVKAFWDLLDKSNMSITRVNALKLMLITGCRVQEMAGLRWSEIDYLEKIIVLPSERTKNKLAHVVPLNALALNIINNTPKLHDIFLFPDETNTQPLKTDGFSQAISRLSKNSTIEKFVPRDLRRTFKTLTGKAGISKEIRDRLQNHALQDVSSLHYDRYDYLKEKRVAMDTWNDYLQNTLERGIGYML